MKKSIVGGSIAVLAVLVSASSALADQIYLGEPAYGGTGCPQGSAAVALSPDATSISILFDSYIAEAGGSTGKRLDRKSCNMAIPVHVPAGWSISVLKFDYRGFNSLPQGGSAVFNAEYFFAGGRGPQQSRRFQGRQDDEFLISQYVPLEAMIWSPCGQDVILRTNASMTVTTNSRGDQALSMVDSQDIHGRDLGGMMYFIEARRCR